MEAVSPDLLDAEMIVRRGGAVGAENEIFLCACPKCRQIVLVDATSRTLYLDGDDLGRRVAAGRQHACEKCGTSFPLTIVKEDEEPSDRDVDWEELRPSAWHWITASSRDWLRIPFEPPAGMTFEPELQVQAPRPLPESLRESWFARERQTAARFLFVFGLYCAAASLVPFVQHWSEVFPPLKLLFWAGMAMAVGGIVLNASIMRGTAGRYEYLRSGVPIVARIRYVSFGPQFDDNPQSGHRYKVEFDYIDAELAQKQRAAADVDVRQSLAATAYPGEEAEDEAMARRVVDSMDTTFGIVDAKDTSDVVAYGLKDKVSLTYRPGDYVTAVHLPEQRAKTIRLYGLLGLRDDLGVVIHVPVKPIGLRAIIFAFGGLTLFLLAMAWNVHAWWRYWPLEHPADAFMKPLAIGAVGFGTLAAIRWLYLARRRPSEDEAFDELAAAPLSGGMLVFGSLFWAALGSITMLCWFVSANALLDEGPPVDEPVSLSNNPRQDTSVLGIPVRRAATIAGKFNRNLKPFVHACTPAERAALEKGQGRMITSGVAEIRPGWLGWPWLSHIRTDEEKPGR